MSDLTIRELQTNLPWTIRYSEDFRKSPMTHKDFAHACHHVGKAMGRLHELVDDCDHDRQIADTPSLRENYSKYLADLVVCALRMANTFPGGVVDLQRAVQDRLESKNNVVLPSSAQEGIGEVKPGPIQSIVFEATAEVMMAKEKWPPFNSAHEGFAILKEEVDELWDHVKTNQKRRDIDAMRKEAIQVAAMAIRFALEICNEEMGRK